MVGIYTVETKVGDNFMTGKERVTKCLMFDNPDRAPRDLWALPYISLYRKHEFNVMLEKFPMDIGLSQLSPGWDEKVIQATAKIGCYQDDWGSVWYVGEPGIIARCRGI
jgi:hypothetical protein